MNEKKKTENLANHRDEIRPYRRREGSMGGAAVLHCVQLVLEVAALLGESHEVGEGHAAEADMVKGVDGAGEDVLLVVVVQAPVDGVLDVAWGQHRLDVGG